MVTYQSMSRAYFPRYTRKTLKLKTVSWVTLLTAVRHRDQFMSKHTFSLHETCTHSTSWHAFIWLRKQRCLCIWTWSVYVSTGSRGGGQTSASRGSAAESKRTESGGCHSFWSRRAPQTNQRDGYSTSTLKNTTDMLIMSLSCPDGLHRPPGADRQTQMEILQAGFNQNRKTPRLYSFLIVQITERNV